MPKQTLAGLIAAAAVVAAGVLAFAVPHLAGRPSHTFQISFVSADGLLTGSDVLEAGSRIGYISDIVPTQDNHALVTVVVADDNWPLRQGVSADIRPKSLLGEKYVDIHDGPASAPVWNPSGPLQTTQNSVPVELDQFINSLDPNTRAAAKILLNDLGAGVAGTQVDLNQAIAAGKADLSHLATFGTTLNNRDADLDKILVGLDGVLSKITDQAQLSQLSHLIDNGQQTVNAIETQQQAWSRQFSDANTALSEINVALNNATGSWRTTLQDLPALTGNLQNEAQMLKGLGADVTQGSTNGQNNLVLLEQGILRGPTVTGGALEFSNGHAFPIFRICLVNGPGTCDGTAVNPASYGGNGYPAPGYDESASSSMLAFWLGD